MNSRLAVLVIVLALVAGFALGLYAATSFASSPDAPTPQVLQLTHDDQSDYIVNVADAYAHDGNLKLAQDRLARLQDPQIAARVETLALETANQRDQTAQNLARLAVALGSKIKGLAALFITETPTPTRTATSPSDPIFSNVLATQTPFPTDTRVPRVTEAPKFVVVPNENPYVVLPTDTPTITPTRRPATRVPTATITPTPTPIPPPPPVEWQPGFPGGWPPGVYFVPANVEPGYKYWHLTKAVYCDFVEENFGCPDRPGNRSGTSIYVINGGAPLDVIRPDGKNVGSDPTQIGDLKNPGDPCECSWTWLVSDYKVSVAGAPSDAIGGFALYTVGGNVLEGHAHVRYFLYFDYVTR
ncbi:MAG: hypothetical protein HY741_25990 [Chloroflexi bacterium]|nr:hypothetical protein [Chloroflexota bacterium]